MLTLGEEILLLTLDDETGRPNIALSGDGVNAALAGAVLMDLSLENRIDTDLDRLFVVNPEPLDEPALDSALARIAADGEDRPTEFWVGALAEDCDTLRPQLVDRLVARRIVLRDRYDRLLAMGGYNGAAVNGRPMRDVKRRLAGELLNDEIPDPRDVMIVSLADICGMWPALIGESAFDRLKPKIRQIAKMDLIGQAVARVVNGH